MRGVLDTIVEGMTEDLRVFPGEDEGKLAALETRADLDRYTYLVAGCVGEFWTEVHVAHRPRLAHWDLAAMQALGVRFGQGLQLTNVLRDIPRDLRHGRCYLPEPGSRAPRPRARATCSTPPPGAAARPLLVELLNVALDHYDAGWQYTFAIPPRGDAHAAGLRLAAPDRPAHARPARAGARAGSTPPSPSRCPASASTA